MHDTLKDNDEKRKLIEFIQKTKFTEKVRFRLATQKAATNLVGFKQNLLTIFKSNRTTLKIQSELAQSSQANLSTIAFANKIESLNMEWNNLILEGQSDTLRPALVKMNDNLSLNAFKNGLNEPTKTTVLAARADSLHSAIQLALDADSVSTKKVYHMNINRNARRGYFNRSREYSRRGHNINQNNRYNQNGYSQYPNSNFNNLSYNESRPTNFRGNNSRNGVKVHNMTGNETEVPDTHRSVN